MNEPTWTIKYRTNPDKHSLDCSSGTITVGNDGVGKTLAELIELNYCNIELFKDDRLVALVAG